MPGELLDSRIDRDRLAFWVIMSRVNRLACSVLVLALAGAAHAQTGKKAPQKSPPADAAADTKKSSDQKEPDGGTHANSSEASESNDTATADDDLGEPPPPRKEVDEETKPSPLTPRPDEFPQGKLKPPPIEYDQLLSDIAALRSRVAALTTTLFKSKLRIIVETDGDDARITSFVVTLDDGVVFSAPSRFVADDEKTVYEHAVAPGHHVIGVEVEREDARGKQYKTWQTSRFSVVVPDSQLLETHMVVSDDSDMAEDFPDDADGEYDVRVRLRARVTEP